MLFLRDFSRPFHWMQALKPFSKGKCKVESLIPMTEAMEVEK